MKILWKACASALLIALAAWWIASEAPSAASGGSGGEEAARLDGDAAWRRSPLWDDGKAEFCAYDATWARYGHRYRGRALLVLVKEPWNPLLEVKADRPLPAERGGFEVLKLNHLRDVPTGIYTYHQMASVFFRRDTGALRKIAAASSEACGLSTAEMVRGRLETRSYFDGEGDRGLPYPAGALPEDGLPLALRDYVDGRAPGELLVFPSLLAGRFAALEAAAYRVERRERAAAPSPSGPLPAIEIRLTAGKSSLAYTFERALPHRLLRFERDDGTLYSLAKCERLPYWTMHEPGGESWLPAALR